ncbi:MAG: nucleotidyltransferase domain-containing protein [Planctomycetia bacterium]|nr:nucleotidyltransferase domain-containing protein [Planctomycetia bacterium]
MTLELDKLADLARAPVPGLRFITVSGAHLYGFPSEDSDIDLRGCYQLPLEDLIGLRRPVETRDLKLDLAGREVELVAHEVGKYLRLLCKHNGYVLEQVFSPLVVLGQEFLDRLRPLAHRCVTRGCYRHYRGFLQSQLQLLEKEEVKKAKTLLYAYRVVLTGIHLLRTGEVQSNIVELNRAFKLPFIDDLIAKKQAREHGGLSGLDFAWHRAELDRWEQRLGEAFEQSQLPEEPPRDEVHEFLVRLRLPDGVPVRN